MRLLDLFSGIGGFSLAARWMNWETVAFCEIDPFCRKILAKNFPGVPIHDDIHTLDGQEFRVDIVTGGFPCQPHSVAGRRRGRDDSRHLWPQFARIIAEARPAWVVIENVPGLRTTAADEVLADLESLGYACWPLVVGAFHTGAPHRRQRVWIVANASDTTRERWSGRVEPPAHLEHHGFQLAQLGQDTAANAAQLGRREGRAESARVEGRHGVADGGAGVYQPDWRGWTDAPQPAVRAMDDGLPAWVAGCRVPALKALGNAIVPQVAYQLFRAIEDSRRG